MEMFFAVIGFLAVVGGMLWYWNSLEGDVRHPATGRKHYPAEQIMARLGGHDRSLTCAAQKIQLLSRPFCL